MADERRREGRTVAGTWRIDRLLNEAGGFGVVYQGSHLRTKAAVAIKFLREELMDDGNQARFVHEARIVASLDHPHVVRVLDVGSDEALGLYQVLELLRGETLGERLERAPDNRLDVAACARILLPVMSALALAHDRGVVHRDVKPGNIFLHTDDRDIEAPKVLDFGIAKNLKGSKTVATTLGKNMGSPQYMAPEQLEGRADPRTDVWAVGVVWYECLTGRRPFDGDTIFAVADGIRQTTPPPLRELAAEVPAGVASAITEALRKEPDARIATMAEFIRRVEAGLLGGAVEDPTRASFALARRGERRARATLRRTVAVGVLAGLVSATLASLALHAGGGPSGSPQRLQPECAERLDASAPSVRNVVGDPHDAGGIDLGASPDAGDVGDVSGDGGGARRRDRPRLPEPNRLQVDF